MTPRIPADLYQRPYDLEVEEFVNNWWQDYAAGLAYPGDLNRHPDLVCLGGDGVVRDPLMLYWPGKQFSPWWTLARRHMSGVNGLASWWSDTVVGELLVAKKFWSFPDYLLETLRGVADREKEGPLPDWPAVKTLPCYTMTHREWQVAVGSLAVQPAYLITPARTFVVRSPRTGRVWVLFGHDEEGLIAGVEMEDPTRTAQYRQSSVREWREALPW